MLSLSDTTIDVVRELTSDDRLPESAGVRLSPERPQNGKPGGVGLAIVDAPAATDQVIDEHGAHVFVDDELAPTLDDKVLDAQVQEGRVSFTLIEATGD